MEPTDISKESGYIKNPKESENSGTTSGTIQSTAKAKNGFEGEGDNGGNKGEHDKPPTRVWKGKHLLGLNPEKQWYFIAILFAVALITTSGIVAAYSARVPYFAIAPGQVREVAGVIAVSESEYYSTFPDDTEGEFGYVTARVSTELSPLNWVVNQLDPDTRIIHTKVYGEDAPDSATRRSIAQVEIRNSQDTATLLVFNLLNIEVAEEYLGLRIVQIVDCADAAVYLQNSDIIIAVDGIETLDNEMLNMALAGKEPGDTARFTIMRNGEIIEDLPVTLGAANDSCLFPFFEESQGVEPSSRAAIGISIAPIIELQPPVDVNFRTGRVGGSSAGLAFTLGLLDLLEPGDLTGGLKIAATGSINSTGKVSNIGGIPEKLIAVERQDYDIFFVPSGQVGSVKGDTRGIEVIGVDTIDDVLEELKKRGGDPVDAYESIPQQPELEMTPDSDPTDSDPTEPLP